MLGPATLALVALKMLNLLSGRGRRRGPCPDNSRDLKPVNRRLAGQSLRLRGPGGTPTRTRSDSGWTPKDLGWRAVLENRLVLHNAVTQPARLESNLI